MKTTLLLTGRVNSLLITTMKDTEKYRIWSMTSQRFMMVKQNGNNFDVSSSGTGNEPLSKLQIQLWHCYILSVTDVNVAMLLLQSLLGITGEVLYRSFRFPFSFAIPGTQNTLMMCGRKVTTFFWIC